VLANIQQPAFQLLDGRDSERFKGHFENMDPVAGHIPGATNRAWTDNLTAQGTFKSADVLREEFQQWLGDRPAQDIVHSCGSGVTACNNLLAMEAAGLTGSKLYPGSWSEYCADTSRPIERS
jgi:thiosulfate/3-mercaptopyruvate sulfurtransferase